MQIQINNNGWQSLDVNKNASVSLVQNNISYPFGSVKLGRTTQIKIPNTPHNASVFELASRADMYGIGARKRYEASIVIGAVVLYGYLYVDNYSDDNYNCVFIFGENEELTKLLGDKDIRASLYEFLDFYLIRNNVIELKDVGGGNHDITIGYPDVISKYTRFSGINAQKAISMYRPYSNLVNEPPINAPKKVATNLIELLKLASYLGVNVDTSNLGDLYVVHDNELTPDTLLELVSISYELEESGTLIGSNYSISSSYAMPFAHNVPFVSTNYNQPDQPQLKAVGYGFSADIKLRFPDDFPSDIRCYRALSNSMTIVSPWEQYQFGNGSLAGKTIEVDFSDNLPNAFFFARASDFTSKGVLVSLPTDDMFDFEIIVNNSVKESEEDEAPAPLNKLVKATDFMPDLTFSQIIDIVRYTFDKQLLYDASTQTLRFVDYSSLNSLDISDYLVEVKQVNRSVKNSTAMVSEIRTEEDKYGTFMLSWRTENENLSPTSNIYTFPATYGRVTKYGNFNVLLADESKKNTLASIDSAGYLIPLPIVKNRPIYDNIFAESTNVKCTFSMSALEFTHFFKNDSLLVVRGVIYIYVSATYNNGIVTAELQKI